MLIVGLTGGLASGKSTVAAAFAARGADILDADQISRDLVAPGSEALAAIVAHFGTHILDTQGALARDTLRQIIFADPSQRHWLEQWLHPQIRKRFQAEIHAIRNPKAVIILVVPLLLEAGFDAMVERVLVVDCDEASQRQRAIARGWAADEVDAAIAAQISRQTRLARADEVIDNSGPPAAIAAQVEILMRRYQVLAQ